MPSINDSKCVLIVGATSGIGRALASSILALPSNPTVVVAGRRQERLDEFTKENAETGRVGSINMNIDSDGESLKKTVEEVLGKYPKLDTVIFSAGIQHIAHWSKPETINLDYLRSEINVNYTAIVTMTAYLLPHFLKLGSEGHPCFISPISSGLGLCPASRIGNYSATKAALHSWCISLSAQLKNTNVHVMEIIPPLVESELHDHQGTTPALSKFWMPLDQFTKLTMEGLQRGDLSIVVGDSTIDWFERYEKGKAEEVAQAASPKEKMK